MKQTLNSGEITPNIFDEIKQYSNKCRTYNSNEYFPNHLKHLFIHCIKCVSTQFRASPFERALFSALNRVLLIN